MGVNLTLKNIPDEIVEQLRFRAKRHRRSLQGEILALIEESLRPHRLSPEELYVQLQKLDLATPNEALDMIRADRYDR